MFETIKKAIAKTLGFSEDKIALDSSLVDDLGVDSLDVVELGMEIEAATGVVIQDEDLPNMKTVQDLVDYVESHQE